MKRSQSIVSLVSERNTKITVEKLEKEMFKFQNDLSRERIETSVRIFLILGMPQIDKKSSRRIPSEPINQTSLRVQR